MTNLIYFFKGYIPMIAELIVIITSLGSLMVYRFNAQDRKFDKHERKMEAMETRIDQAYQVLILHVVGEQRAPRGEEK